MVKRLRPPFHGGNRGSNPLGVILRARKRSFRAARNRKNTYADVAQLAEQLICNQQVNGSSPFIGFHVRTCSSVG